MWRVGFFFHEMAFGLLSVFLPLYVVSIGGSLLDVGLMASAATLVAIPASFFWGYICDKTGKCKRYILISFLASSALLYLFTLARGIGLFIVLYVIMAVFHIAHEPPKNVLIAELYSREEWEESFASYEGFTEIGWLIGLALGLFVSFLGFNSTTTLLICSGLNFSAFAASLFLVTDPPLIFERGLVRIERSIDFACRGIAVASKVLDGLHVSESLEGENVALFCGGLALFAFATSTLFTPLPIFLVQNLRLEVSTVYAIYVLNSTAAAIGYFLAGKRLELYEEKMRLQRIVVFRSILAFLLSVFATTSVQTAAVFALVLTLMGFAYALYHIYAISLSMELIPAGKAGLFDALLGLGSAAGAYLGPLVAQTFGFMYAFILSGATFFSAYVSFKASF
ncbi:MAG: MFS transporter [Nitrososphaerota archaeon]|nr:MFS transporter [Candidatus Bathyarchaeota archaeon]MDW8023335.1 MFS transporter [Nitrososphaerota archaeon]